MNLDTNRVRLWAALLTFGLLPLGTATAPAHAQETSVQEMTSAEHVLFSDDFEDGSLGSAWSVQPGEGGVARVVDRLPDVPSIPRSGDYALALGREEDGRQATVNTADLRLDLSGQEHATLRFSIREEGDDTNDEDAIFLSDDGGERFQRALRLQPAQWGDGVYATVALDLAAAAERLGLTLTDKFMVRFQQSGTKDFAGSRYTQRDGFFIDDVVVLGAPTYTALPFEDGFEAGTLGNSWRMADPYSRGETAPEMSAQWGLVEPVERLTDVPSIPYAGDRALALGRPIGGDGRQATTNAVDLHLDLSGQNQVTLRFSIRDEGDDSDEYDGLFLSDDGGENFEQALRLQPGKWGDGVYGTVALDLTAAAQALGLDMTNQFVVRFQQSGTKDFAGSRYTQKDGFFIDDVVVRGAPTYATLPFEDGFEAETLGASWRMADPYNAGETALDAEVQWGLVEPVSRLEDVASIPRSGDQAFAIGRPIGGDGRQETTNAADLHLDLSGQSRATLRFYLRDEGDDSDEYDAVFLSDDGGKRFEKALDLDPEERPDGEYGEVTLDLAQAAQNLGLKLSEQFVVRFQQRGTKDFAGSRYTQRDGFFIDDLSVRAE